MLAARPEVAPAIRAGVDAEDLDEDLRETFGKMLGAIEQGGADELQARLPQFEDWEQDLVRQAWAGPPPGFDEDEVVAALIRRVRMRADKRRREGIISDLAEAESTGDLDRAARLMRDYEQLMRKS